MYRDRMENNRKRLARTVLPLLFILFLAFVLSAYALFYDRGPNYDASKLTIIKGRVAVATILTTDSYYDGVTTLYRSFNLNTHEGFHRAVDFVVLYTDSVNPYYIETLRDWGCVVKRVQDLENPYNASTRFDGSFAKLHVWNMTDYHQVAYLDADCLIASDPRLLFECNAFCVRENKPHMSDTFRFNAGVMVVVPDSAVFHQMLFLLQSLALPSADQADQGFLNSYFFYYCYGLIDRTDTDQVVAQRVRLWRGDNPSGVIPKTGFFPEVGDETKSRCKLLPWTYNFDVDAHGKWVNSVFLNLFVRKNPIIYQYTGSFKPWTCIHSWDDRCSQRTHTLYTTTMTS